jgi:hypothetical protein
MPAEFRPSDGPARLDYLDTGGPPVNIVPIPIMAVVSMFTVLMIMSTTCSSTGD